MALDPTSNKVKEKTAKCVPFFRKKQKQFFDAPVKLSSPSAPAWCAERLHKVKNEGAHQLKNVR